MNRNLERTGHVYPTRMGIPGQPFRDYVTTNSGISVSEGIEGIHLSSTKALNGRRIRIIFFDIALSALIAMNRSLPPYHCAVNYQGKSKFASFTTVPLSLSFRWIFLVPNCSCNSFLFRGSSAKFHMTHAAVQTPD